MHMERLLSRYLGIASSETRVPVWGHVIFSLVQQIVQCLNSNLGSDDLEVISKLTIE